MRAYNLQNEQPPAFPDQFQIIKNAVLSRTSLEANNNKFYVLEVHEEGGQYRLFTNYGRVGTDGVKEGRFGDSREEILAEFERIYKEKTGPRKGYVPVEVEKATVGSRVLRTETEQIFQAKRSGKSSLHCDIVNFVEHIYDESKSELVRRIETPLGSLSKSQIERGADKLRELRFALARDHQDKIVPLTGQYYSLIPHRLGRWTDIADVAINSIEKADAEEELLQLMRDVYHVQNDLEAEVDRKYRALGASLEVVERDDPQYRRIERKVLDTQSRHHYLKSKVNRVFRACLPDERARFETDGRPCGNVHKLFHGTKNCNMVGILSRGLLIAPKSAPVTGYMFGKGIYFADQSSKSAQYSLMWANNRRPFGYLFLADVALGKVKKETGPLYREEAPHGYHSVQGCKGQCLVHNEFIIYQTAQCTLRYIAEIQPA
ncbi:MAG: WGR domain-containing protein [Armatimonadetes bacterium]|nr:WGR domain-containing protein [Armatimonadota bacterium]